MQLAALCSGEEGEWEGEKWEVLTGEWGLKIVFEIIIARYINFS